MKGRPAAPQWVSAKQIPVVFGITERSVRDLVNAGGPVRRRYWGRKPLYSAEDIDSYISGLPEEAHHV